MKLCLEVFEAFPFLRGKLGRRRIVALVEVRINLGYMTTAVYIIVWLLQLGFYGDPRPWPWPSGKCSSDLLRFFSGTL